MSSHSFRNLYTVDFINYVRSGGTSLQEDVNILHHEDKDSEDDDNAELNKDVQYSNSGYGEGARPIQQKPADDEGAGIRVYIVRNIDDYIHRGRLLKDLPPYLYRALITRVNKNEMNRRSKRQQHAGKQPSLTYDFDPEHSLAHSHTQRLNQKPIMVKLVRKQIPKDPGCYTGVRNGKEFNIWTRKLNRLTNYVQAVFLPFRKTIQNMRTSEEIQEELKNLKQH